MTVISSTAFLSTPYRAHQAHRNRPHTMNDPADHLVAFVPRIDKRQPDVDLLHQTENGSARMDIKNRKFPWIHLVIVDIHSIPDVPSLLTCKKGTVLLTRSRTRPTAVPPALVPENSVTITISAHDSPNQSSQHWAWMSKVEVGAGAAGALHPVPATNPLYRVGACVLPMVESMNTQSLSGHDFELKVECIYHGWLFSWVGRLAFTPSNSRGDWGIAADPHCPHYDLDYLGEAIVQNSPSHFYRPRLRIFGTEPNALPLVKSSPVSTPLTTVSSSNNSSGSSISSSALFGNPIPSTTSSPSPHSPTPASMSRKRSSQDAGYDRLDHRRASRGSLGISILKSSPPPGAPLSGELSPTTSSPDASITNLGKGSLQDLLSASLMLSNGGASDPQSATSASASNPANLLPSLPQLHQLPRPQPSVLPPLASATPAATSTTTSSSTSSPPLSSASTLSSLASLSSASPLSSLQSSSAPVAAPFQAISQNVFPGGIGWPLPPTPTLTWELSLKQVDSGAQVITIEALGFTTTPVFKYEPHSIIFNSVQDDLSTPLVSVMALPRSPCSLQCPLPELKDAPGSRVSVTILDFSRTRLNHQELFVEIPRPRPDKRHSLQFLMQSTSTA